MNNAFNNRQQGMDRFDLEAARDGAAARTFQREYAADRACTRNQAKRGVVRGKEGAKSRKGLFSIAV